MRAALLGFLLGALVGCGVAPDGATSAGNIPAPPDPACVADEYAYFGETTMAALGVSRPSGRPPLTPTGSERFGLRPIGGSTRASRLEWLTDACSASSFATTVVRSA